jgi:hypothetical protein
MAAGEDDGDVLEPLFSSSKWAESPSMSKQLFGSGAVENGEAFF